jgi:Mg-chelatase subunit ChlD
MTDARLVRWRLVLGGAGDGTGEDLHGEEAALDAALGALYDQGGEPAPADQPSGPALTPGRPATRGGDLSRSAPSVARWLGDVRRYFPSSVVRVIQRDALDRLGLRRLLLEPELLAAVEPDVHLVSTLLALNRVMPETTRESARAVVRRVVEELERRLALRTRQAVAGALDRATRTRRPARRDVDWNRTILANLRHYQPEHRTVVPERLVGFGRRRLAVARDLVLCIDQSGSMAASLVYAAVFGAALAGVRTVRTRLVVFDTAVVDLSDHLGDPVDLLFATRLGGGTDIAHALAYCAGLVQRPQDTLLVLVSDLFDGGDKAVTVRRVASLLGAGVQVVALLALSDEGKPAYDHDLASTLAGLGVPAFACTPDRFPDLMAAAIERRDLQSWAAGQGLVPEQAW